MAFAQLPPHIAARMSQERALHEAMNSPDPVMRYKAKEQSVNSALSELGCVLAQKSADLAHKNHF